MNVRVPTMLFAMVFALWSQPRKPASEPKSAPPEAALRVRSDLVLVPAIVTDENYRPVFSLQENQFQLKVDKAATPLAGFWKDTGPLSVVIVLDASGSMGFGLGTASPIVTGTGITLPVGTWAIGERVQFISYDTASDAKLLGLANANPPGDLRNDVH